jgi:hypothetical protein
MGKEAWLIMRDALQPKMRSSLPPSQSFIFPGGPPGKNIVQGLEDWVKGRRLYPFVCLPHLSFGNGFALFTRLLPFLVDLQIKPDNAAPSVQFHYRTFPPTTDCSAPVSRIGTLTLMRFPHLSFSLIIGTTGSHVPHKSLDQVRLG